MSTLTRCMSAALLLAASATAGAADTPRDNATLAARSERVFGKQAGQSFDAQVVKPAAAAPRTETVTVTLKPGKGAEVQADMDAEQAVVFHWTASDDVAVDLHGERPDAHSEYTSYDIQGAQREGAGTLVAPFAGTHGWFWKNKGQQPVTVTVTLTGFYKRLVRHGGQP